MLALLAAVAWTGIEPLQSVRLVMPESSVRAGPVRYAIEITPKKGWHLYWKNPGDSGVPPSVKWDLPPGWKADELQFPAPERIVTGDQVSYGYEGKFGLVGALNPPKGAKGQFTIKGKLAWMACEESCLMGTTDLMLAIQLGEREVLSENKAFTEFLSRIPAKVLEVEASYDAGQYSLSTSLTERSNHYFYCETEGVLAYSRNQTRVDASHFGSTLKIPKSEFATEPAKRLRGILSVSGPKGLENYVIDTPVKSENLP